MLLGLMDLYGAMILVDYLLLLLEDEWLVVVVDMLHHGVDVLLDLLVDGHVYDDLLLFLVTSSVEQQCEILVSIWEKSRF